MFTVTLKKSGRRFAVAADETVLEAAQRAGIALSYSCRAGICASCKATLLEGRCVYPHQPPLALDADERAHHAVLLCQAVPASDLLLEAREVPTVEDIARRELAVVVVDKRPLAPEVTGLYLAPIAGEPRLRWLPGQYLDVLLPDGRRRAFSIASGPRADGMIELHVRHVAGGGFTSQVADGMKVGDALRIEGPLGTFVAREDSERPLIFMAGGTGIAPVKALIEHFIELGTRRAMTLYWGVRTQADLYLRAQIETWQRQVPQLVFVAVFSGAVASEGARRGLVHAAVLADHPTLAAHDVYMSGPPPMVDAARHAFVAAGLPEDRLYYDSFAYAPDVLAKIIASRAGFHF